MRSYVLYIVDSLIYMFHVWNIEREERKAKYISLIDGRERTFQPQQVFSAPRQTGIPDP